MVAPVPAQISKLPPRLPPQSGRHPLPSSATSVLITPCPLCCAFSRLRTLNSFAFLSHPCNPSSFMRLRTLLRNGAPRSLLFSMASALFLSPRGCTSKWFPTTNLQAFKRANSFVCIGLEPLCRLFTLFPALVSFVFNRLQPLFTKYRGWGYPERIYGTPRVGVA